MLPFDTTNTQLRRQAFFGEQASNETYGYPRFYTYSAGTYRLRWKFDPLSHGTEEWGD